MASKTSKVLCVLGSRWVKDECANRRCLRSIGTSRPTACLGEQKGMFFFFFLTMTSSVDKVNLERPMGEFTVTGEDIP